MKKHTILALFAGLIAIASLLLAAEAPTTTETLVRIQTDPPTGGVTAFFEKAVTIDGVVYKQPWTSVSWQLGADKSVTVGGTTMTYTQVMGFVLAIAQQEKVAQATPPPPPPPENPTP